MCVQVRFTDISWIDPEVSTMQREYNYTGSEEPLHMEIFQPKFPFILYMELSYS
jgi:hypothetical protein